jgi:hypothetical protein
MRIESRAPAIRCSACDIVPLPPAYNAGSGRWVVSCPCCGRAASGDTEAGAREAWADGNRRGKGPLGPALELLDAIEAAMCDLEAIRTVPGAMTAWHDWMDALGRLRAVVEEAGT